ncbi:MAG: 4Fe-4S binding protein [Chitinispirillales bacterium]|jgi:ferredoxin|nr:4Fe-4S binding protein [Chitinispirillales bacterium]
MLKKIRVAVALFIFCPLTFYFLDFAGLLPVNTPLLRVQFIPAILSLNVAALVFLLASVMIFGRIYCSVICPMGVLQDIANRCSRGRQRTFGKNHAVLRLSVLAVCLVPFLFGFTLITGILDPYGAYGRIAVHLFKPVYMLLNNALAYLFNSFGNYTFYRVEVTMLSVFSFVTAILTITVICVLAYAKGRLYCNTVCPVGTVLGCLNKYSLFKIRIDKDKCVSCGVCEKRCKASCIDMKAKTIDYSRCVNCFNCINNCGKKAISFSAGGNIEKPIKYCVVWNVIDCFATLAMTVIALRRDKQVARREAPKQSRGIGAIFDCGRYKSTIQKPVVHKAMDAVDDGKREFILTGITAIITAPAIFARAKADALPNGKKERQIAVNPPGSVSAERLLKHCTSCHLCVSKCPTRALKPAFMEYGVGGVMMPVMYFEKGFCNFDCTVCTNICPTGALLPLTKEQKHRLQVGRVVFVPNRCVVTVKGTSCGACSEHCPTQAVKMIAYKNGLTIPSVDADICVGCGGCEFICPVRPYRAIYVEGNGVHQQARAFEVEKNTENEITDFGF